jgi:Transcriptional regulators
MPAAGSRLARARLCQRHQSHARRNAAGYEVISFVLIQLQSQAQAPLQAFEKSIAAVPLVLQSWRISGDADYLLKCVARNVEGMHQQLLQFSAMPEVRNIRTFPVLGVAKDAPLPIPNHPTASGRAD